MFLNISISLSGSTAILTMLLRKSSSIRGQTHKTEMVKRAGPWWRGNCGVKMQEKLNFIQFDKLSVSFLALSLVNNKIQEISLAQNWQFDVTSTHAIFICLSSYWRWKLANHRARNWYVIVKQICDLFVVLYSLSGRFHLGWSVFNPCFILLKLFIYSYI